MSNQRLLDLFLVESQELIAELESGLVQLEKTPEDSEIVHRLFRAAHTLKSSAGMTGIEGMVEVAHALENILEQVRSGGRGLQSELITALLQGADVLKEMLRLVSEDRPPQSAQGTQAVLARLARFQTSGSGAPASPSKPAPASPGAAAPKQRVFRIDLALAPTLFETGPDPALLFEELAELGELLAVEPDLSALPPLAQMDPAKLYARWRIRLRTPADLAAVQGVFLFVADRGTIDLREEGSPADDKPLGELLVEDGLVSPKEVSEALGAQKKLGEILVDSGKVKPGDLERVLARQREAREHRQGSSVRVGIDKLDRLVNLVGELAIAAAQVHQSVRDERARADRRLAVAEALLRISRDIQEQVMSVRMLPVEETFNRFQRMVRDLSLELGKKVALETSGTETELDKNVLEQLADPLKHMVRNSLVHGIEAPAERAAAGKPGEGRIRLSAAQCEGEILIEVSDDGRGIDPDKVLAKARAAGLVREDAALSRRQILELIFLPGLSTAAEVSELAGRGVGLDVVRRNVENLRGSVRVQSEKGAGTTFQIKLPLTLAIIEGLHVMVGEETLVLPILSVVELISVAPGVIQTVEDKGELVTVRGELVPVTRLRDLFGLPRRAPGSEDVLVIVEQAGRKFGVLVDRVLGVEQAVIKPLDSSYALFAQSTPAARSKALAGASIRGDGGVGLIVDVGSLERLAFGEAA